ncbi:MAG: hypothetical protein N4A57_03755 [Anaeromicrobium sp.]|jgi:hypothetical protein|uniref:hypothetical protein n=1 Tax=Anaeromicrobium sp. TaxID=1929132 RepID=UPI0025DF0D88|nr:hypothetical protein [Anaeromicrobium sp.]MCT4593374.1 hypothetical protein [Anaeromicrobium sp.]
MSKSKNFFVFILITALLFTSTSCTKKSKKPSPEEEQAKKIPEIIKELEKQILTVTYMADLVPYYERSVKQREELGKKELKEEILKKGSSSKESDSKSSEESGDTKESGNSEKGSKEEGKSPNQVQDKPDPLMFQEMLLADIIKEEKVLEEDKDAKKVPQDLNEVWKKISDTVISLHETWNTLEPMLLSKNAASVSILEFDKNLELLTKHSLNHDYFNTLLLSNKLTYCLAEFMAYGKGKIPPTIYSLKYFLRDCVLKAAKGDFSGSKEDVKILEAQSLNVKNKLKGKNSKTIIEKFEASIKKLNDAIDEKDVNLIKIHSSIVMKNVISMANEIESQI